jgi:tetratricopeptide (TPR) repeat protein
MLVNSLKGAYMQVAMTLSDPTLNKLIGVSPVVKKLNPFSLAIEHEKAKRLPEAEAIFHDMLGADFDDSVILASLGLNLAVQGKHGVANIVLSRALELFDKRFADDLKKHGIKFEKNPKKGDSFLSVKKAEICNGIGSCYKQENIIDKSRYWFDRAQSYLSEPSADIQNNLATLYINEGSPEKAIPYLTSALKANKDHAQALWNLSLCLLEIGDYEKGFALYGNGKRADVRQERNYSNTGTPEWDGSPGKTVVVYGEQGIGDEIMFASMLPDAIRHSKQIIFESHTRLATIFRNSFPNVDVYGTREDAQITWPMNPDQSFRYEIDAKIAIGDLGKFFRKDIKDFPGTPYLTPTYEANEKWAKRMNEFFTDGKPVIGLNWIGGVKRTRVEVRSLTLEQMLPILSQDAHFVALQYTDCEAEIYEFEQKHGIKIYFWPEAVHAEDYDNTAAVVANCDLVISNCSSVIHLAGAMGVPTWVLTPSRPAWRYRLDLDWMPWYGNSVTLYRQAPGSVEWGPVVDAVAKDLDLRLNLSGQKIEVEDVL